MLNIIKNSWIVFTRNKDYFMNIILAPISILLICSIFISFDSKSTIALMKDGDSEFATVLSQELSDNDAFNYKEISKSDMQNAFLSSSVDILIEVSENADEMIKSGTDGYAAVYGLKEGTALESTAKLMLDSAKSKFLNGESNDVKINFNKVSKRTLPVTNSLGMILFKLITCGSMLTILILNDRKNGIRGRIYLSGLSAGSYLMGMSVVFIVSSIISSLVYFIILVIFRFETGLPNDMLLMPILITSNLFAACFAVFLSSVVKNVDSVWTASSAFILPTTILAGGILPYENMPVAMQKIADFLPQRWMLHSLENLQTGGGFAVSLGYLMLTLALGIVLFSIGAFRFRKIV